MSDIPNNSHPIEHTQWEPYEKLSGSAQAPASHLSAGIWETMKHDCAAAMDGIETSFKDVFTPGIKSTTEEKLIVAGVAAVAINTGFGIAALAGGVGGAEAALVSLKESGAAEKWADEVAATTGFRYDGGLPVIDPRSPAYPELLAKIKAST